MGNGFVERGRRGVCGRHGRGSRAFFIWEEVAEVVEELGEVVADDAPFDPDVGGGEAALGFFGDVGGESVLDDGDDLFGGGMGARCVDGAAIAEGFEVGKLAGGVEGGEFGEGFGKWDVENVEVSFGRDWFV